MLWLKDVLNKKMLRLETLPTMNKLVLSSVLPRKRVKKCQVYSMTFSFGVSRPKIQPEGCWLPCNYHGIRHNWAQLAWQVGVITHRVSIVWLTF